MNSLSRMTTIRVVRIADAPPQPQLLKPQRLVASPLLFIRFRVLFFFFLVSFGREREERLRERKSHSLLFVSFCLVINLSSTSSSTTRIIVFYLFLTINEVYITCLPLLNQRFLSVRVFLLAPPPPPPPMLCIVHTSSDSPVFFRRPRLWSSPTEVFLLFFPRASA